MANIVIKIARDFSEFPTGRYERHGEGSGEEFRVKTLLPHLENGDDVTVVLDDTVGYPSSFLEEAFGGLIRSGISINAIKKQLKIVCEDAVYEPYRLLAWKFIDEAHERTLAN